MIFIIQNLIDILIVSYLIYMTYTFLANSYYFQLLKGLLIIIFIYFISIYFHLNTLSWILKNLFQVAPIILIILFQNEIRNFIFQLGKNHRSNSSNKYKKNISKELAEIIFHLKSINLGTSIVMIGQDDLTPFIKGRSNIYGKWSKELFIAIFNKQSPLHDGACIIHKGRIISAGSILPTSKQQNLSKVFGTRHLSAIGISEVSDALAITVSEENSKVSVSQGGILKYDISEEKLRKKIRNFIIFNKRKSYKNYLNKIYKFLQNLNQMNFFKRL